MSAMAAGFVLSVTAGVLAAALHSLVLLAMLVVLAALSAAVCVTLKLGPPGSYFQVLVGGAGSFLVGQGVSPWQVIAMTAIGGVVAVVVGMGDLIGDPHRPEREAVDTAEEAIALFEQADLPEDIRVARAAASATLHQAWTSFRDGIGERTIDQRNEQLFERIGILQTRYTQRSALLTGRTTGAEAQPWGSAEGDQLEPPTLDPEFEAEQLRDSSLGRPEAAYLIKQALHWPSEIRLIALRVGIATLLSGIAAVLMGFDHSYWGVAFAALVLHQGGSRYAQTLRGLQRLIGTLLGLGVYALILWWNPQGGWLVLVIFALQFSIEMLLVRSCGSRVGVPACCSSGPMPAGRSSPPRTSCGTWRRVAMRPRRRGRTDVICTTSCLNSNAGWPSPCRTIPGGWRPIGRWSNRWRRWDTSCWGPAGIPRCGGRARRSGVPWSRCR